MRIVSDFIPIDKYGFDRITGSIIHDSSQRITTKATEIAIVLRNIKWSLLGEKKQACVLDDWVLIRGCCRFFG
jgi:hypothetical protein